MSLVLDIFMYLYVFSVGYFVGDAKEDINSFSNFLLVAVGALLWPAILIFGLVAFWQERKK